MTPAERAAGRVWREACGAMLAAMAVTCPPDAWCSPFIHSFRHECPARDGVSTALELHERYEASPGYLAEDGAATAGEDADVVRGAARVTGAEFVRPGLFGFIWKQGTCGACGMLVRSRNGWVVLASRRPPAEDRKVGSGG